MMWNPDLGARIALPHDRRGGLRKNSDRLGKIFYEKASQKKAWKYADSAGALQELGMQPLPDNMQPNGASSMLTTASDYARFLAAAMKNPDIRKEQIELRAPFLYWGLGWAIERTNGHEYIWQWGDNGGYKNIVFAEPSRGEAIFVFTNGDSGARVYDRVVTQATGHDHPALFWI